MNTGERIVSLSSISSGSAISHLMAIIEGGFSAEKTFTKMICVVASTKESSTKPVKANNKPIEKPKALDEDGEIHVFSTARSVFVSSATETNVVLTSQKESVVFQQ